MTTPKTHRAIVLGQNKDLVLTEKPLPTFTSNEILVKVKAIAMNPSDVMHAEGILKPGDSIGCDFAGVIVEVGSNVQNKGFRVGDPVAGWIRGGKDAEDNGAFQEYVKTLPELVWRKPGSITYEDAAAMGGIALSTAAWALYRFLGVHKPWQPLPPASSYSASPILIWAGSTAVGLSAIALAKLSGIPVISTSSPQNFDLLKSVGAEAVFDYKDTKVVDKIQKWMQEKGYARIPKAFDTVSRGESTQLIAKAMGAEGGKIIRVLPDDKSAKYPSGVDVELMQLYSVQHPEESPEGFADMAEWNKVLPSLIEQNGFRNPMPLKVSRGFQSIPKYLEYMKAGNVSGQKLAVVLGEEPSSYA